MKKLYLTLCLLMAAMFLTAQEVPQAINFQAIARDANSEVMANTQIMIQLTILDGAPEGAQVYREIRSLMTNNYGSFSFQIGRDPYMSDGNFADIDWAGGRKFLKIDYDPTASLSFDLSLGTIEFVSVPYAFAAGSVSYIDATGANDGDVLAYNATTGRFEPVAISGAGGGIAVETDPTVPDWAKAENKPTYDYSEIENTPDLSGYLTTESQTLADVISLSNSAGNNTISDLAAPVNANDAVTKSYVDNLIAQLQEAINNIGGGSNPVNTSIVVTGIASDITATSAIISAEITSGGDLSVTSRGFVYGTSESDLSQMVPVDGNLGPYMATLNDLTPNTTYYYKAYATNILGTAYGDVMSFTLIATYPPTVITTVASEISAIGATISGNVTSDGGFAVTERGFVYGTSADELTQTATCGSGSGSYTKTLNNLTPNTTYYYKAYATNRLGTAYGDVMSFTLIATYPPTVITTVASEITATGATISGNVTSDGGFSVTERGFVYGTNADELTQTATCGIFSGSYTKTLNNLTPNTTYYYKAYATNRLGTAYGDVMSFTTETSATTGTLNGHDWVDLGLPSGTKWATCNVGASTPTAYGNYYAWGETTTKTTYNSSTYTYSDNPNTLPSSRDAATANWGSGWRMPTREEMDELYSCSHEWTTQNGVNGRLFTGPNGNSIFLPAAGRRNGSDLYNAGSYGLYWSSSLYTDNTDYAWYLRFDSGYYDMYYSSRYYGLTVRPVCVSAQN